MILQTTILSHVRQMTRFILREILKVIIPVILGLFPVHRLWKRAAYSDLEISKEIIEHRLGDYEYSLYSQNGEDGIIDYLFSQIGVSSKLFLEFGFGVIENNSLRLILKNGWGGVLMDGSGASVKAFNRALQKMGIMNVQAIQQFLDLENLKPTILNCSLPEQIDLLSIDVDGNDYWFWKDITYLTPRVVIVEYNASLGPDLSITVPYDPLFERYEKHPSGFYHGASLTALVKLAHEKGYVLVGCDSNGVNAFFVREDCLKGSIREILPSHAYFVNKRRVKRGLSPEMQFEIIKNMPYINIE